MEIKTTNEINQDIRNTCVASDEFRLELMPKKWIALDDLVEWISEFSPKQWQTSALLDKLKELSESSKKDSVENK